MMQFSVVAAGADEKMLAGPFEALPDALRHAQSLMDAGTRCRVKKFFLPEHVEKARAVIMERITRGDLKPVPDWLPVRPEHLAHLPPNQRGEPGTIMFYPTEEALVEGRAIAASVGRYLGKYSSLRPEKISELAGRAETLGEDLEFLVTGDQKVVQDAYINNNQFNESSGTLSCMHYDFGVKRDQHPCNAYGGESDLQIAVLRPRGDTTGYIKARCVVWPEKKSFVRLYGEHERYRNVLLTHLTNAGYKRREGFEGARLNVLLHPGHPKVAGRSVVYMAPYMDGSPAKMTTKGIIHPYGSIPLSGTNGGVQAMGRDPDERPDTNCPHCRRAVFAADCMPVLVADNGGTQQWCQDCVGRHASCDADGVWFSQTYDRIVEYVSRARRTTNPTHTTRRERQVAESGFWCDATRRWYSNTGFTPIVVVPPRGRRGEPTQVWCAESTGALPADGGWTARPAEWMRGAHETRTSLATARCRALIDDERTPRLTWFGEQATQAGANGALSVTEDEDIAVEGAGAGMFYHWLPSRHVARSEARWASGGVRQDMASVFSGFAHDGNRNDIDFEDVALLVAAMARPTAEVVGADYVFNEER